MHIPHTQSLVYTSRQESQNVRVRCRLSEFAGWHAFDVDTKYEATERERYYGHFVPFCQCVVYFNFIAIVYVCPLRISYTHTHTHQTMRECMGQCVSLDEPQAHTPYTVHRTTQTLSVYVWFVCLYVWLSVAAASKRHAQDSATWAHGSDQFVWNVTIFFFTLRLFACSEQIPSSFGFSDSATASAE